MKAPMKGKLLVTQLYGGGSKYGEAYEYWDGREYIKIIGHTGIDIDAPLGTPIYAVWDCVALQSGNLGAIGIGLYLALTDPHGRTATYGHLSSVLSPLVPCPAGTLLGYTGSSGHSTGPHLHFQIQETNPDSHNGYFGTRDPLGGFDHDVIPLIDLSLV